MSPLPVTRWLHASIHVSGVTQSEELILDQPGGPSLLSHTHLKTHPRSSELTVRNLL